MAFIMSFHSAANSSGRSRLRIASDGMVRMMPSNSSSAQGEGAVRSCDHSSFVVTPEKKKHVKSMFWKIYCKVIIIINHHHHKTLTRLIIWCKYSILNNDLKPIHFCFVRCNQVDQPTPQVAHLHHLGNHWESPINTRCSLQFRGLQVVGLTTNLDLKKKRRTNRNSKSSKKPAMFVVLKLQCIPYRVTTDTLHTGLNNYSCIKMK